MSHNYDNIKPLKALRIHRSVVKELEGLDPFTNQKLAELLYLVQLGARLGMPVSRPMPNIANGVHELRIKDKGGPLRVFYYVLLMDAILVFYFLRKKTQSTPKHELRSARKRLEDML